MTLSPENPFALRSTLPFELPPFSAITDDDFLPAFLAGFDEQLAEVAAIVGNPEPATFANTIVALEQSGQLLGRVAAVFNNKTSGDTNEKIDEIEAMISPQLAAHRDRISLDPNLFARIAYVYDNRAQLHGEELRLVEQYYEDFVQAGAELDADARLRLAALNERLSTLETLFGKQLLADSNDLAVLVENRADLDGLGEDEIAAAAAAAVARGHSGKWLIGAVNFSGNPVLTSLSNRGLRQRLMEASLHKGARDNGHNTQPTLLEISRLRAERAALFGLRTHAEYVIRRQTASSPERVHAMLRSIAPVAAANARAEAAALQEMIDSEGGDFTLESWDWPYYAERLRAAKYHVDESAMRPYFDLERVLRDGVFFAANALYGLTFAERVDLIAHHPDARVFEVRNEADEPVGLYVGDFYTRDSKHGGAWMDSFVEQNRLRNQLPVVFNHLNIPKPPPGSATLLTYDETTTLFHEFGHALHGLLSDVTYPRLSGTNVQRDFVEFPSQVNEMWLLWPEVVGNYARHHETGETLPSAWIDSLNASRTFNEGYTTVSYLAAAVLDLAWHSLAADDIVDDVEEFERRAIAEYGLDVPGVPVRYRSTYFAHVFAGGYSAGYYGYIWSEVLDADTVEWFREQGGLLRANGEHFRQTLLGRGASRDSLQMYRDFRGRDAVIDPLLRRRGLLPS